MTLLDFTFEFLNEVDNLGAELENRLRTESEDRLRRLGQGHSDLVGASVSLESLTKSDATPHLYQARVVVYARPEHVASVSKQEDPITAMNTALDTVERQIRDRRKRLSERPQKQSGVGADEGLYELSAQEVYQAFTGGSLPDVWIEQTRDRIATRLMVDEGLNQDDAYYAADQILVYAQELLDNPDAQNSQPPPG